jgi:hypothetical protein
MSFIELIIVNLNNVRYDNQLEESRKNVSPKVAAKCLHDPNKLGHLQE